MVYTILNLAYSKSYIYYILLIYRMILLALLVSAAEFSIFLAKHKAKTVVVFIFYQYLLV